MRNQYSKMALVILILITNTQVQAQKQGMMDGLKWLLGTWEQKTSRGSVFEKWSEVNESEFSGLSYAVNNQDTVIFETIRLVNEGDILHYIPAVKDQNNGKPVTFKSTFASSNKLIFEAPEHDYPQMITYTRIDMDKLVAEISGISDGDRKYVSFFMTKLAEDTENTRSMSSDILGLRTTIYKVGDMDKAKEWYKEAFQTEPYFVEPYYIGFNIGGYELGLQPEENLQSPKIESVITYWGVEDIQKVHTRMIEMGALENEKPFNVGGPLMVSSVRDPWGNVIGLIYNPEFRLEK